MKQKTTFRLQHKILIFICLFQSISGIAQNWTGNINSDWNNSANWTGWPLAGDDIVIDPLNYTGAAASPEITVASVFIPGDVVIQNGAQLTVQNNLTATGRIEVIGTGTEVTIISGTINAAGSGSSGRFIVSDGGAVIMNGGTINCNQHLIIELGGSFVFNNGNINVTEVLALVDGNNTSSSYFNMAGGTITIGMELSFENEAGIFYPSFEMTNGLLTVNGDLTWLGVSPGAGIPKFLIRGGTVDLNGNILNGAGSTVDLHMEVSGTAQVNFDGTLIDLIHTTDSILLSGTSAGFVFLNTGSWNNEGVFIADSATISFNGSTTLQGMGIYSFHNIMISNGAALNHLTPGDIEIKGNFMNDGSFNNNLNEAIFKGLNTQAIGGTSGTTFNKLLINNPEGIILGSNVTVKDLLTFTDGVFYSDNANLLILSDNAAYSGASDSTFVNGPMKKRGDDAFVFPIGKNNELKSIAISAPANINAEFFAEYIDTPHSNSGSVNPPLISISDKEYWILERGSVSDNVQVSLFWENADSSGIDSCSNLSIAEWDGNNWNSISGTVTGVCSGSGSGSIQSDAVVNNYMFYTFGTMGTALGLETQIASGEITLFPNPLKGNSKGITIGNVSSEMPNLIVRDALGKIIPLDCSYHGNTILILELNVNPGIYFITLITGESQITKKLVVE